MNSQGNEFGAPEKTTQFELRFVVASLLATLLINLLTGTRFPAVWLDEVQHTDPAANWLLGRGFTSTAWYVQPHDAFWAGNVPFYHAMLCIWMKIFGFNLLSVRAFGYCLNSIAVLLLWSAARRLNLLPTARGRMIFIILILLGYGTSLCARAGRYDPMTIVVTSLALWCFSINSSPRRFLAIAASAVLLPWSGIQLIAFAAATSVLLFAFTGTRWLRELIALGFGIALGGIALWAFYLWRGVWRDFLGNTQFSLHITSGSFVRDPSFYALLFVALALCVFLKLRDELHWRSPLVFGVAAAFWIPAALKTVGRFPTYYSWMAYVPLAIGVSASIARTWPAGKLSQLGFAFALALPCLVGLPLQLASTFYFWPERDYSRIERFVANNVQPNDYVYCDPEPYYAVKKSAAAHVVVSSCAVATPEDDAKVNVLIVRPFHAPDLIAKFGGKWTRCPEVIPAFNRRFLWVKPNKTNKLTWDYNLEAWRKEPAQVATTH